MTDDAETEVPVDNAPDDATDGTDDDPPLEDVPLSGTPEDGVTPALFGDETDPASEVRP